MRVAAIAARKLQRESDPDSMTEQVYVEETVCSCIIANNGGLYV
jgi:hypothetical protein